VRAKAETALITPVVFTCIPLGAPVPTKSIRGTITGMEAGAPLPQGRPDQILVVKQGNNDVRVSLNPDSQVMTVSRASLAEVEVGTRLTLVGVPEGDGSQAAVSLWLFPGALHAGNRAWDLKPRSRLMSGSVTEITRAEGGMEMVVSLLPSGGQRGKSIRVLVRNDTPVVRMAKAELSILKPGNPVFLWSNKRVLDCAWETNLVFSGSDGLVPPM
jgi:hypothetical protein